MAESSDDDLFLSASEGENEELEANTRKMGAKAVSVKKLPIVEKNVDISLLKEDANEKANTSVKAQSVAQQHHEFVAKVESAAVEKPKEEPSTKRTHFDEEKVHSNSGSTEVMCNQEISEAADVMPLRSQSKSISEDESSSKELHWDDFNVETEEGDENGDGWDTWDGSDTEKEELPTDGMRKELAKPGAESSDWFSEQIASECDQKRNAQEKKAPSKSKGSLWEWTGITEVVSAVGEGFSNVVENSLGLPSAEDMARITTEEEKEKKKDQDLLVEHSTQSQGGPGGVAFGGMFSGFVTGGLDVLESLGKKTFETLTVKDDETSRHSRRFRFQPEGPANLSQLLKERMNGEEEHSSDQSLAGYGSTSSAKFQGVCFQREFDQEEGSVHLEGLHLISTNYSRQQMKSSFAKSPYETMLNVDDSDTCSSANFESELKNVLSEISLPYNAPSLLAANRELISLTESTTESDDEIYKTAITVLAKFTAQSIQVFHKLSQLMLIADNIPPPHHLIDLTQLFCRRINFFAQEFAESLNSCHSSEKVDEMVTTVFFEASNALHHLRTASECFKAFY